MRTHHIAGLSIALVTALHLTASAAQAAFTTEKCLPQKANAWGKLRQCQRGEDAKRLKGKAFDVAKCQTKFAEKLAKISDKASDTAIACRYGDNGDGTITDYDTGLHWEKKVGGSFSGFCVPLGTPHCVDDTYSWESAQAFVGGTSSDGSTRTNCFSGHCDWRLPTVAELRALLLEPHPCGTSPCIDGIFGPTAAGSYWSSTTLATNPDGAWEVDFDVGFVAPDGKNNVANYVRVVRSGL